MTHTKVEAHVMIEETRNNTSAGGSLVTIASETVNTGDTHVKRTRELTNHYKPEAFPTKSKCDKAKDKIHIRGFYAVATDPDTKFPRLHRVKFVYTCVVNGNQVPMTLDHGKNCGDSIFATTLSLAS